MIGTTATGAPATERRPRQPGREGNKPNIKQLGFPKDQTANYWSFPAFPIMSQLKMRLKINSSRQKFEMHTKIKRGGNKTTKPLQSGIVTRFPFPLRLPDLLSVSSILYYLKTYKHIVSPILTHRTTYTQCVVKSKQVVSFFIVASHTVTTEQKV